MTIPRIPQAFVWKRLHSLAGLWMVLFLIEHLLTNSQAALWLGDSGAGFVAMVDTLHNLPYLRVIEITLLGVPFAVHMAIGVKYALRGSSNLRKTDGSAPSLPHLGRNRAYALQRITSWFLLFCIIGHVTKFRFIEYPKSVGEGDGTVYLVKIRADEKLVSLSDQLGVDLYDSERVNTEVSLLKRTARTISGGRTLAQVKEDYANRKRFVDALQSISPSPSEVIAASGKFGSVTLLSVRATFQNPIYRVLYTLFVAAACFHAFNGLWTFVVGWGFVIRAAMQRALIKYAIALTGLIAFLGLAAIWGS